MEAVGRLAGGVAHDFNNLLTAIIGYSQLALGRLHREDPMRKEIEEVERAGQRAAGLTNQLLAFSRRQVLQPQVLDLNAIVSNLGKMLERLIGEDIELATTLGRDIGFVKADRGQIEQIIMNLVVNSRDAMPEGGKLTIETFNADLDESYTAEHIDAHPGAHVVLAISDNGSGIDKETQSNIFEPFFTTKEQGKGTGLGLSTVYGIVKQSGGHIGLYSEAGEGTTFKVYLPRFEEAGDKRDLRASQTESLRGSETVLLVEDENSVRQLARRVLEINGYVVLEAARSDEAWQIYQGHPGPIHLMLTDIVMPGTSGRELAQRLTALQPETKVLYMSGYTDDAIVHHGVLGAGTPFLQKPFTPESLARKVREVLDKH
jgi:CheY-like chemotaxis protein/two-component sensor histidine kinase